jgi:hypothetical protein
MEESSTFAALPLSRLPTGQLATVPLLTLCSRLVSSLLAFLHKFLGDEPLPLPPLQPHPATCVSSTTPITSVDSHLTPPSSLKYEERRHLLSANISRYLRALAHLAALLKAFLYAPAHRATSQLLETTALVKTSLANIHASWLYADKVLTLLDEECAKLWDRRRPADDTVGALEVLAEGRWTDGVKWDSGDDDGLANRLRGEIADAGEKQRIVDDLALSLGRKILGSSCVPKLKALPGVQMSYSPTHLTLRHHSYVATLTNISPPGAGLTAWVLLDVVMRVELKNADSGLVLDSGDRDAVRVVGQAVLDMEVVEGEGAERSEGIERSEGMDVDAEEAGSPDPSKSPLLALHHHMHLYTMSLHLTIVHAHVKTLTKQNGVFGSSNIVSVLDRDCSRLDVRIWRNRGVKFMNRVNLCGEGGGEPLAAVMSDFVGVAFVADPVFGLVVYMTGSGEGVKEAVEVESVTNCRQVDVQVFVRDVRRSLSENRARSAAALSEHEDVEYDEEGGRVQVFGRYGGVRVLIEELGVDQNTGMFGKSEVAGPFNMIAGLEGSANLDDLREGRKQVREGVRELQVMRGEEMAERARGLVGVGGEALVVGVEESGRVVVGGKEVVFGDGGGNSKKRKAGDSEGETVTKKKAEFVTWLVEKATN